MKEFDLSELFEKLKTRNETLMGYPVNTKLQYDELLHFYSLMINNVGDPIEHSQVGINTLEIENEVINFMTDLLHGPKENHWGYVTSGGSEGNLYGLYLGREKLVNPYVYYSKSTHYSVYKNIRLLGIPSIVVKTMKNGEIDYDDLHKMLDANRHVPPMIVANVGTTMTEARDRTKRIHEMLNELALPDYYLHVDAAFCGFTFPFQEEAEEFDFRAGADSIAVSGHKFLGMPMPCGIVLVKKQHRERIMRSIPYINSYDTTISGSRSGHAPLFLYHRLKNLGKEGLALLVKECEEKTERTLIKLLEAGVPAWRNPNSLTIVLPKPTEYLCKKYQLATQENMAHIIITESITDALIDDFISELKKKAVA